MAFSPAQTQNAIANGDTRTLTLYHTHTRESIQATFRVNGQYDQATLDKLNWFLRDWRRDEPTKMDPRLFDVVWETYRESGSQEPIQIVSAYRSPETNAMLRRRSKAVAEYSQHMLGKAMDMHYVDVPMARIRELGMKLQRGGVGYYPTAGTPFVHLDVGNVRAWPRMSYDQLARLFPDGKTVHLPPNGQPLARYEEARAEIEARGGGTSIPTVAEVKSKGFFAMLFGGGDDEESGEATPPPAPATPARGGPRSRVTTYLASRNQPVAATQVASAEPTEDGIAGFFQADAARRSATVERAERDLPRGETYLSPSEPAAPLPPARPTAAAPEARTIDAPLPPRRPSALFASLAPSVSTPLPPARPPELRPETTRIARANELPAVITTGGTAANPAVPVQPAALLAFAPPADGPAGDLTRSLVSRATPHPATPTANGLRPTISPTRPEFVAARLDRGNFGTLTTPSSVARSPASTNVAQAQPARTELSGVIFSQPADVAMRFGGTTGELSASRFTGPAVRALPRLEQTAFAIVPASRLN